MVIQRVAHASVSVDGKTVASIGSGLCLLVGVEPGDGEPEASALVDKVAGLRVFGDTTSKMNLSLGDVGGEVLVVSQFTLLGELGKGRRPSFSGAAPPEAAAPLIDSVVEGFRRSGIDASQGVFGARMTLELANDGPVTLIIEVREGKAT